MGSDFDDWVAALGRRVPGGTDFNYIATDTHVLSAVLRAVYGKPLAEIAQEKLWEPGGFAGDAMWGQDASGHFLGHFALSVRLQEFAHLGQLYLDDLVLNGRPTVSDDWFDMVSKPHAAFQEPRENPATGRISEGYTFQFWLPLNYDEEFMASGCPDVTARQAGRSQGFGIRRESSLAKLAADAGWTAFGVPDFGEQHAFSLGCGDPCECGGDGCSADAAFACDEVDASGQPVGRRS